MKLINQWERLIFRYIWRIEMKITFEIFQNYLNSVPP